jgi:MinD-like ATPase involved in chromosome partitioning or flagellar assembly
MPGPTLSVLLVTRDADVKIVAANLQSDGIASRTVSGTRELQRAIGSIKGQPVVAVLDGELAGEVDFPIDDVFSRLRNVPLLVLLPGDSDGNLPHDSERTSPAEYARKPVTASVLALRIKALVLAAGLPLPLASPAPAVGPHGPLELHGDDQRGEMTVVFSVKGGSGKSTIAAHLAVGLATIYSAQTLLVDADLWFGDIGVLLNLNSARSSFDVCGTEDPDLFALPKAVVQHSSGASVLLRPPDPLSVEKLKLRSFVEALDRYRSLYEHVIVDCQSSLDELNLDLLEAATRILLVTTPEMGAVHNTARFLGLAERLHFTERLTLVVNRANSGIGADALQRTLGIPVGYGVVSAGRMMLDAVNEGTTLFAVDPTRRERITQDLAAIVELVAGREQPPVQRETHRGLGLRLLRRSA